VIPRVVPPLTGLTVLVTRPLPQARALAEQIGARGGEAIVFPTIAIEPVAALAPEPHDWIVFVSVHAVEHGAALLDKSASMRIAAIGKATASALAAANLTADVVPEAPFTSEALLAHPAFQPAAGERVLIVRGSGGRETLRETLSARGVHVGTLDVYRRVCPQVPPEQIAALETRWSEDGIDVVTATSFETYANLIALLTPHGRELLARTPLVAASQRIVDAASESGWRAQALIAAAPDDATIVGTLARWRARARDR
jgi:uroporphyrinogen-III synthase